MAFFHWLSVCTSLLFHPFYISMTDINYNAKAQTLEVSVRIFADDFEKTLRKNCNCKVELLIPQDKLAMEKLANNYIQKHLQVKIDGKLQNLEFNGYKQEDESIWNYYLIKDVEQCKKIDISNTLLYDYRQEQINMLHIQAFGKEQSDKLDFPESKYSLSF